MSINCNINVKIVLTCLDNRAKNALEEDVNVRLLPYLFSKIQENLDTADYENPITLSKFEGVLQSKQNKNKAKIQDSNPVILGIEADSCINFTEKNLVKPNLKMKVVFEPEDRYSWNEIKADVLERLFPYIVMLSNKLDRKSIELVHKIKIKKISYSEQL